MEELERMLRLVLEAMFQNEGSTHEIRPDLEARVRSLELHVLPLQPHNLPSALPGEAVPLTEETNELRGTLSRSKAAIRRSVEGLVAEQAAGEHEA